MPGSTTPSVSEIATDGIDRIAAGAQRVEPGLRGQRMIGADRAVAAHDQRRGGCGSGDTSLVFRVQRRCAVKNSATAG